MTKEKKKDLMVKCPTCKKRFSFYDSEFRPFCSERCKQIDLGHWLTESYSIAAEKPDDPENPTGDEVDDQDN